jgi:hypothetical protein
MRTPNNNRRSNGRIVRVELKNDKPLASTSAIHVIAYPEQLSRLMVGY